MTEFIKTSTPNLHLALSTGLPLGESVPHPHSSLSNLEKMTGEGCVVSLYYGETQAGLQKDFTKSQKEEEAPGWESHHTQLPWGRMLSWHPGKQADESFHHSAIRGSSRFQFSQLRPALSPADFRSLQRCCRNGESTPGIFCSEHRVAEGSPYR